MEEMQEIIDDFLVEADELISSLDTNLVALESTPDDLELLNEIFRAAHTVKGTSSFLGFEQVTSLTHKMEDVLNKLRKDELKVTQEIMDTLLESVDILKVLLDNVRTKNDEELNLDNIIARLTASNDGTVVSEAAPTEDKADQPTVADADQPVEPSEAVPANRMTNMADIKNRPVKMAKEQTIRVDVDRLDSLMNLMGELVLSRNSLLQTINAVTKDEHMTGGVEKLNNSAASVNYITSELQEAVMKMRMQPIGKVFSKFPRMVRDLSRDLKKEINLQLEGETTELDKSVIEEIGDPLVHIIRNSCDHGIELPEDRLAAGKPSSGQVTISASQEGSNIIIKIQDDGKGLDAKALGRKAVEKGLATENEVERMPDREIFRFIFAAGFSTAKVVSDVSGRGVGMDVVRTNIEKLNGQVELDSQLGVGTTIIIKLPLTLAIIQGLLVEADDEVFILPLASVYETVRTDNVSIYYVNQKPVMRLRDEIIPLINMGQILRENASGFTLTEKPYAVVVGLAEKKLGILIDHFLGQEEVVIKSLGQYLGSTSGIAGATILGDGRIRLIVDLIGLFKVASNLN
ncbi:MAG: chemotaxis protein CheA [candidate division Zixibacteria bacterium]|nr:chemotaxis protein CheA [candidate division Zixibacteria bacterium]